MLQYSKLTRAAARGGFRSPSELTGDDLYGCWGNIRERIDESLSLPSPPLSLCILSFWSFLPSNLMTSLLLWLLPPLLLSPLFSFSLSFTAPSWRSPKGCLPCVTPLLPTSDLRTSTIDKSCLPIWFPEVVSELVSLPSPNAVCWLFVRVASLRIKKEISRFVYEECSSWVLEFSWSQETVGTD